MAFTPVYGNASVSLAEYLICQGLFLQRIAFYGIMKGIDHSYYYEGYATFKAEDL